MTKQLFHLPVLHQEVIERLCPSNVQTFFDGTLGLGGHAERILQAFPELKKYIATELDPEHLAYAQQKLERFAAKLETHHSNFAELETILNDDLRVKRPLSILLDLGLCSNHVDQADKGFSFQADGPLKMSFSGDNRAEVFLNEANELTISRVLKEYGEIRQHRQLAKKIVETRAQKRLETTGQLRALIESVIHPREYKKVLGLTFQAIRMEVNDELNVIKKAINGAFEVMQSGDRLGVISYHSLEDRLVKQMFKTISTAVTTADNFSLHAVLRDADFLLHTKKPILPTDQEIAANPRARSAKLRIIERK